MKIDEWLGPTGRLIQNGREFRSEQLEMAQGVERSLEERHHLLVEAGTGTGKTLAYLVPVLQHLRQHGGMAVIATATIALQDQLVKHDLPILQDELQHDLPFRFALQKGLSNYWCRYRAGRLKPRIQHAGLFRWSRTTETGDRSDAPDHTPSAWADCSVGSDDCLGDDQCPQASDCFGLAARQAAHGVDILVVSYALLFAHLTIADKSGGMARVLPSYSLLVCDEAHRIPSIARQFFGWQVGPGSFRDLWRLMGQVDVVEPSATKMEEVVQRTFDQLKQHAESKAYRIRLRTAGEIDPSGAVSALESAIKAVRSRLDRFGPERRDEQTAGRKVATRMAKHVKCLKEAADLRDGWVHAIELIRRPRRPTTARLTAMPIEVGPELSWLLFGDDGTGPSSAVLTSATLVTTPGPTAFDFIEREVGGGRLDNLYSLQVGSPFDYPRQALLVMPDMPDPNSRLFGDALAWTVLKVWRLVGEGVMALFTSYRALDRTARYLQQQGPDHPILQQGQGGRIRLLERFRNQPGSILLGTSSFWTGVDLPGRALRCVVIDRLPFPHFSDPLMDALAQTDKSWFFSAALPRAIMELRQGVGRLIRTKSDIGAVVLADNRIRTKPYGKVIRRALPSMRDSTTLTDIRPFLQEHGA